ncbi:RHS repeat-associated core domain-containing protein [bacterium]|nr:RHS repeat-associated core domain-containing protein [bacterium]
MGNVDLATEAQGANILAYYTQGQGLLSQMRNNASYFNHYDGLGSAKALTDANQNIQSTTIYDAWGNILQATGTITNPYLYVGELGYYGDGDAGMYLLTQRWYNPVVGRFVVRDPLKAGRCDLYVYVLNDPQNLVDPAGLKERCPTIYELPKGAKKCFYKCLGFGWVNGMPTYYVDLKCLEKCVKDQMDKVLANYICCLWWKYIYGGEDISKDPWVIHPCEEETSNYELAACERCCHFQTYLCDINSFAPPVVGGASTTQRGRFFKRCYWNCASGCALKFFKLRRKVYER